MWLLCREITKLDIWLAVWQLCLLGGDFHYQRHKQLHEKDYAITITSSTITVLVVETNSNLGSRWTVPNPVGSHRDMSLPS